MGKRRATVFDERKRPEGVLQNIITYFCFKANPLSDSKLVKLVYLADVYYYQRFGERITDVPFKHYYYGPWAPDIAAEVEKLSDADIIREEVVQTRAGYRASVPTPAVPETTVQLTDKAFEVLQAVVEDWGDASTDQVVSFAKSTLPFLGTPFDAPIDFSRSDPVAEYAKKHRIAEEDAATEDVLSSKFLTEKIMEGEKSLRQEGRLLTDEEVFGD